MVLPGDVNNQALVPQAPRVRGLALRRALWLSTFAWLFGSVWANATAGMPLTNFAQGLHLSDFEFGVLAALPFLTSLISLPASLLVDATGRRKGLFLAGLYLNRLMWVPIALVPLWLLHGTAGHGGGRTMLVLVFLGMMFLMYSGQAIGNPGWQSWMADLVPDRCRGRYFSHRKQWGLLTAIPAAWGAGWLLDRYAHTGNSATMMWWCAGIFLCAAAFGCTDIFCFQFIPEIPGQPQRHSGVLAAWREPLRNRQYIWFAGYVAVMVCAVAPMGQFVTLYVKKQLETGASGGRGGGINTITQLMLLVAPAVAQLFFLPIWGKAADRMGKRPLLRLAGLGLVPVALGWCLVNGGNAWLGYVLAAAGGALWAGIDVTNTNLVLEFAGSDAGNGNGGSTTYVAVNSVIINLMGFAGGLLWGAIADGLQRHGWQWHTPIKSFGAYDALFVLSAGLRLLAVVVFLPRLQEPAARPTREALRFMTVNIYNNLYNAVLEPLRFVGLGKRQ